MLRVSLSQGRDNPPEDLSVLDVLLPLDGLAPNVGRARLPKDRTMMSESSGVGRNFALLRRQTRRAVVSRWAHGSARI
jgi:hypothetical protein